MGNRAQTLPSLRRRTLNFLLVGQHRAGMQIVQSAISGYVDDCGQPTAVCHGSLLEGTSEQRKKLHEAYFGCDDRDDRSPVHFVDVIGNPVQYVVNSIFDNPRFSEKAVGLRVSYQALFALDLFENIEELCLAGDFCVIHILRNPLCCFVSLKQAQSCGLWTRSVLDSVQHIPYSIRIDPIELTDFVRQSQSVQQKVDRACDDALKIQYRDLCLHYDRVMRRVGQFLELPTDRVPQSNCRRIRNFDMAARVINWETLGKELPSDVRALMKEEELY